MKKIFLGLLAFVCLSFVDAKTIKVGMNIEYKPFEYIDENNKVVGFDVELLDLISKRSGLKFEIINMPFDSLIVALKGGKIDMAMSAMSATDDRRKHVDFSLPYYSSRSIFIQKKGKGIKNEADLKGKRIGAMLGTTHEMSANRIKKQIPNVQVMIYDSITSAILALKADKIDVVIDDSIVGLGYIRQNVGELEKAFSIPDESEGISIAFDKGKNTKIRAKIDKAILELKDSKEFDKLAKKYNLK